MVDCSIANSKAFFNAVYSQSQKATSKYTDYFPNLQGTYRVTPDLLLRAALTRSMSRPGVQTILPNTTVNDTAAQPSVTVTNGGILPSYSRNLDFGFEFYTHPAGKLELSPREVLATASCRRSRRFRRIGDVGRRHYRHDYRISAG